MKLHWCLFVLAGVLLTTHVNAEVYKCTAVDSAARQNKVIYTDVPCNKTERQILTTIPLKSHFNAQALQTAQTTPLAQAAAVDSAVTSAVLRRDFKLAKSLAATKEHWRLIAIAAEEAPPQPLMLASSPAALREAECADAKYNFESASRTSWRDKDLVAAKKSIMYVACGEPEPVQSRPIFVGRTYGGLYHGSWYHPHHAAPHRTNPHKGVGHQAYPINHHGHHHTGGGASLSYKSKHFSIHANSINAR